MTPDGKKTITRVCEYCGCDWEEQVTYESGIIVEDLDDGDCPECGGVDPEPDLERVGEEQAMTFTKEQIHHIYTTCDRIAIEMTADLSKANGCPPSWFEFAKKFSERMRESFLGIRRAK